MSKMLKKEFVELWRNPKSFFKDLSFYLMKKPWGWFEPTLFIEDDRAGLIRITAHRGRYGISLTIHSDKFQPVSVMEAYDKEGNFKPSITRGDTVTELNLCLYDRTEEAGKFKEAYLSHDNDFFNKTILELEKGENK